MNRDEHIAFLLERIATLERRVRYWRQRAYRFHRQADLWRQRALLRVKR